LPTIMKNSLFAIITVLILISCSSTNKVTEEGNKSVQKSNYKNILVEKFKPAIKNETRQLNEVKYEGVFCACFTQKGMYDRFGKWDEEVYIGFHPILFWNKVKLFPNDTTEFIVAASGLENTKTTYASVLVFDQQNKDLLTEESEYKTKLIEYFSEMINSNNPKRRYFYEVYWKTVDPKRWEQIKQYQKNK